MPLQSLFLSKYLCESYTPLPAGISFVAVGQSSVLFLSFMCNVFKFRK